MRRTIELLINRVFRSRWGIALLLAVLVFGVIGIGRLITGGQNRAPVLDRATPAPAISIDPSNDDSAISLAPAPLPSTSPGTAAPEAVAYAFASAWVDHKGVTAKKWYDGLLPHATKKLAGKLDGVDPEGVPASSIIGRPTLVPVGEGLVEAVVTVDTGKLRLRLLAPDGHWLVDSVDWEQS